MSDIKFQNVIFFKFISLLEIISQTEQTFGEEEHIYVMTSWGDINYG